MSDSGGEDVDKDAYIIEYAKSGQAACKGRQPCNGSKIGKGQLRLGTLVQFGERGDGYQHRHWGCVTSKQLANLQTIYDDATQIGGYDKLEPQDQERVKQAFDTLALRAEDLSLAAWHAKGGARAAGVDPSLHSIPDSYQQPGELTSSNDAIMADDSDHVKPHAESEAGPSTIASNEHPVAVVQAAVKGKGRKRKVQADDLEMKPENDKLEEGPVPEPVVVAKRRSGRPKKVQFEASATTQEPMPGTVVEPETSSIEAKRLGRSRKAPKSNESDPITQAGGAPVRRSSPRVKVKTEEKDEKPDDSLVVAPLAEVGASKAEQEDHELVPTEPSSPAAEAPSQPAHSFKDGPSAVAVASPAASSAAGASARAVLGKDPAERELEHSPVGSSSFQPIKRTPRFSLADARVIRTSSLSALDSTAPAIVPPAQPSMSSPPPKAKTFAGSPASPTARGRSEDAKSAFAQLAQSPLPVVFAQRRSSGGTSAGAQLQRGRPALEAPPQIRTAEKPQGWPSWALGSKSG